MSAQDPIGDRMVERYLELYEAGQQQGLSGADLPSFALINLVLEFAFLSEPGERQLRPVTAGRVESPRIPQSQ